MYREVLEIINMAKSKNREKFELKAKNNTTELDVLNEKLAKSIVELEESQRTLKKSERRNKAILNALPDIMFVVNSKGKIFDFQANNPGVTRATQTQGP